MSAKYFIPFFVILLSNCKIADGKRPVTPTDNSGGNTVFSFIKSEQVAVNIPAIAVAMSGISATALVATKESTFQAWIDPTPTCYRINEDGVDVSASSVLNIGDLRIGDFTTQEIQIPYDPKQGSYFIGGTLASGDYRIANSGTARGSFSFTQDFVVLPNATSIKLVSGDNGVAQPIASPSIPSEGDSNYLAVLDRSKSVRIEYEAPENTSYVRMFLYDGSNIESRPIVCYSPPFTPMTIPEGMLLNFRQTDDAYIFVDFVSVSVKTDIPKIKEAVIQSYKRHIHGKQEFGTQDGNITVPFGILRLE
jgi:hypothetical protein